MAGRHIKTILLLVLLFSLLAASYRRFTIDLKVNEKLLAYEEREQLVEKIYYFNLLIFL
jgi:hypothetical protein